MPDMRNKYGAFTKEFMEDFEPHAKALGKIMDDLAAKEYSDEDILSAIVGHVTFIQSSDRVRRGVELRKKERE
jgi:hypothetical protein